MNTSHRPIRRSSQQGIAHLALIVLLLVVVSTIGFVGWKVAAKKSASPAQDAISKTAIQATCAETDKNICKFMTNFKQQKYVTVTTKTTDTNGSTTSIYQVESTSIYHVTVEGDTPFETIIIGNDTYTKASTGVWWKKSVKPEEIKQFSQAANPDQKITDTSSDTSKNTMTYKNLGTEACGILTCYKYQVIDSSIPDDTSYVWFDTKDYLVRHTRDESKGGAVIDATYVYNKFTISVPSPVKELGPNQVLIPGQSQPTTLPDSGTATGGGIGNFPGPSGISTGVSGDTSSGQ